MTKETLKEMVLMLMVLFKDIIISLVEVLNQMTLIEKSISIIASRFHYPLSKVQPLRWLKYYLINKVNWLALKMVYGNF